MIRPDDRSLGLIPSGLSEGVRPLGDGTAYAIRRKVKTWRRCGLLGAPDSTAGRSLTLWHRADELRAYRLGDPTAGGQRKIAPNIIEHGALRDCLDSA